MRIALNTLPLPLFFEDAEKKLFLGKKPVKAIPRFLGELKPVLFDKEFASRIASTASSEKPSGIQRSISILTFDKFWKGGVELESRIQYFMHRGLARRVDEKIFRNSKLSFDVTVIPALHLGKEFNKTLGHYHALASSGRSFPEVYEVLLGNAIFLLQKRLRHAQRGDSVGDVIIVRASKGTQVIVPPDYGHVTVNIGRETLVTANLCALQESDYAPFVEKKGAAYYVLRKDRVGQLLKPNPSYVGALPEPREWLAQKIWSPNIYAAFVKNPRQFIFLTRPEKILLIQPDGGRVETR